MSFLQHQFRCLRRGGRPGSQFVDTSGFRENKRHLIDDINVGDGFCSVEKKYCRLKLTSRIEQKIM